MLLEGLAPGVQAGESLTESLGFGLTVAAIGIGVVFAVLVLLCGLMVLIGQFREQTPPGQGPAATVAAGTPAEAARPQEVGPGRDRPHRAQPEEQPEDRPAATELRLAAAVAAALAASWEPANVRTDGRGPGGGRHTKLSWALSGRIDSLTAREKLPRG